MSKGIYRIFRTKEELNEYNISKCAIWMQMFLDAMVFALHEEYGFAGERLHRLDQMFEKKWHEMNAILSRDVKEDKEEMLYSRTVIDRDLKAIVGEKYFRPWDERYKGI